MSAVFSDDRVYRYTLTRWLVVEKHTFSTCVFVCLNPSTADETKDDPTVRQCIGFARTWGYERLVVCNIFALRSTDPSALYAHEAPEGDPENLCHIEKQAAAADRIVAAWGTHGNLHDRGSAVASVLARHGDVHMLGLTVRGHPRHPLYLPRTTTPERWEWVTAGA